jgi:hypothetical protein
LADGKLFLPACHYSVRIRRIRASVFDPQRANVQGRYQVKPLKARTVSNSSSFDVRTLVCVREHGVDDDRMAGPSGSAGLVKQTTVDRVGYVGFVRFGREAFGFRHPKHHLSFDI